MTWIIDVSPTRFRAPLVPNSEVATVTENSRAVEDGCQPAHPAELQEAVSSVAPLTWLNAPSLGKQALPALCQISWLSTVLLLTHSHEARPDDPEFMMVDPKMVGCPFIMTFPHLLIPVVTNPHLKLAIALRVVDRDEETAMNSSPGHCRNDCWL